MRPAKVVLDPALAEIILAGFLADYQRKPLSTLSSPAILSANYAAPCRQTLGRMLIHPLGELRRAHQAGLHRDLGEVRGGDNLLVAICRRGKTAEHGDDLDHDNRASSPRRALVPPTV